MAVSICFAPPSLNTQAKSKKKSLNLLTAKSDSTKTDYAKVTKGGKKDTGLFTVIYIAKAASCILNCPTLHSVTSISLPTEWQQQATHRILWLGR